MRLLQKTQEKPYNYKWLHKLNGIFTCFALVFICMTSFNPVRAQLTPEDTMCTDCGCETTCQTGVNASDGIQLNTGDHVNLELDYLRQWIVNTWFTVPEQNPPLGHVSHALMLLTSQLTTVGIQQIQMIGGFFDAKHQLETQQLFQTLTAKAHKDYHPSEGLCTIGTGTRSLAQSERVADLTQMALTKRTMDRSLLSRFTVAGMGEIDDRWNRIHQFIETFCNPEDNASGLNLLCGGGGNRAQYNMDVDFTSALENKLTLDMNMTSAGAGDITPDEQNIFALHANLIGNKVSYPMPQAIIGNEHNDEMRNLMSHHIRQRSFVAKRSVAQNSLSAITAMRASGTGENAPFLKSVIRELGVNAADINPYLGANPSYFAQMEVLTKKLYQNPSFYADLYDKPANIERKGAAMQAIAIMQDRDIYDSLLRSEAVLATLLETSIRKEHVRISGDLSTIRKRDERY